jgi:OFA family oxalate/formate antiporter-like MFS transporter
MMPPDSPNKWRPYPTFRGWWIVGVGFTALYLNGAAMSYMFGILVLPMEEDLGWSRATLLGALMPATFVSAIVGSFIGPFIDRHGARVAMTISALFSGAFMLMIPFINAPWQWYVIVGLGLGATRSALDNVGPRASIANWFIRRRAAAFAWFSGGRAVFGVTAVAPLALLVERTSWRSGWFVVGTLELTILAPLVWTIIRRRPEDHGQLPDGDTPRPERSAAATAAGPEWTRAEAMRTPAFWLMVVGFIFAGFPASGVIANMIPYFRDQGLSVGFASVAFSLFGAGALAGRPLWGFIGSRVSVHTGLMLYGLIYSASLASLVLGFNTPSLMAAAFFVGIPTGGAAQLQSQAWPDYYGRRSVGAITGVTTLMIMPAMASGPLVAALAFDALGSYNLVFSAFAVGTFISGVSFYLARRPSRSPVSNSSA